MRAWTPCYKFCMDAIPPGRRLLFRIAVLLALLAGPAVQAGQLTLRIDGVEGPLKAAVLAAGEIAQYDKKDVTAAQAKRLYDNAPEQIGKSLEAYGYFNAKTDGELKETPPGWTAIIHVRPGEPTRVAQWNVEVPAPARNEKAVALALAGFAPRAGDQLDSAVYEKSKAAVQSALFAQGYLDANLVAHTLEIVRSANRANLTLKWDVGRRYRFGPVAFQGSQLRQGFLERYIPWRTGDFFTQGKLLRLQQKLIDADYFGIVDVIPDREHAHDGIIPINVKLAPAKRNIYTAGVFVDSDIGFGVKGGVARRWLNDNGHKLKVEAQVAQRENSLGATYSIPLPGLFDRSYNFDAVYNDMNTATVQSKTLRLDANEQRQWHGFTRTLGINVLGGTYTVANIDGRSTELYPEIALERKQADDRSFVRDGYALTLDARASPGLLSDTKFAQVRANLKWIRGIGERQRMILRGSLGATAVDDFDKLPPELRFFAGGDRSIRGFAFQAVGPPLAEELVPIAQANCRKHPKTSCSELIVGGKNLAIASAEYEYYFRPNWGIATFVDAGDAFSATNTFRTHVGTGVGLRWRSPVGMVRVDIGVPVRDPENNSGVQLHLMIGPDL
jgi:translocation and assembly module TamA